ncbi:beta-lactamase-like protein [Fusarium sp. MPI-SDFR-AT-0072]|nr:beta-lactamase-like protein [Fusarium sp. MPI-SDFR-AT-0072]
MGDIKSEKAPTLELPSSSKTVRVKAIDTTTRMSCDANAFVQPQIKNHERLNFKTLCFLLEHDGEFILFDCGSRKDFWNSSPQTSKMIGSHVPGLEIKSGVDEILVNQGFDLDNLKAIVWSHWHWDHVGDGSKFPASTDIVVGPGFTQNFVPGWPENPESPVLARDLEGHRIHEPDFTMNVAGFPAFDYFGDGSFYLLDVPGHAIGHICGLARTTPHTFVFMGGDCCHYAGALRPTRYLPLPKEVSTEVLDEYYPSPCPCSVFTQHHPKATGMDARIEPFYDVSRAPGSAYSFPDLAQKSINSLQDLDAQPNIFICLAHDEVLFQVLPLFNDDKMEDINDWQKRGFKEYCRWGFLNDLPKGGKPGRKPLVVGQWRDGRQIAWKGEEKGFVNIIDEVRT